MQVSLCLFDAAMENKHVLEVNHDKSSLNGPYSIAMFNNERNLKNVDVPPQNLIVEKIIFYQ